MGPLSPGKAQRTDPQVTVIEVIEDQVVVVEVLDRQLTLDRRDIGWLNSPFPVRNPFFAPITNYFFTTRVRNDVILLNFSGTIGQVAFVNFEVDRDVNTISELFFAGPNASDWIPLHWVVGEVVSEAEIVEAALAGVALASRLISERKALAKA